MKTISTIEEGVQVMLEYLDIQLDKEWKYVPARGEELADMLEIGGKKVPVFWWRYDNQVFPLEGFERTMDSVSCKINTVTTKAIGLDRLIFRAFDIAEWFLKSDISKLNCYRKGSAAEIILTMENKKVAMLELAATLKEDTDEQGRITVWGRKGVASNRVVSQKDMPQSIYMYTDDGNLKTYNDMCTELYGLSRVQVIKVAAIVDILSKKCDIKEIEENYVKYQKYLNYANLSATENRPYKVKGE